MAAVGDYKSSYSGEQVDRVVEKGLAAIKTVTIAGAPSERITVPYGAITGTLANQEDLQSALDAKQGTLTAGTGITISNNVISATTYTAGSNIQIVNNVISATDTVYTAGTGINISADNEISATASAPTWGSITGTLSSQTDLNDVLVDIQNNKQSTIQYSTMPTATQSLAGKIAEYTGTTTTDFTHGYIYEAMYDPESLTVIQTAGYLDMGDITVNLSTFKSAIGSGLTERTYLFKFVGYPTEVTATHSTSGVTMSLTRDSSKDTSSAYAWVDGASTVYFVNSPNLQIGATIYDSSLEATSYTCTDVITRSTTVNFTGVWVLDDSDVNINLNNYGLYSSSSPVVGTILSATYVAGGAYWQQRNVQPVRELTQTMAVLDSSAVTLVEGTSIYAKTISENTTFTFDVSGLGSLVNKVVTFELCLDMTVVYTLTFPNTVTWIEEPDFTTAGKYLLVFRTFDSGSSYLGNLECQW